MAVGVNVLWRGEEIAPHAGRGGKLGQGLAEGLDGQPAVIANAFQRGDGLADLGMAASRRAAIVLADVDVVDVALGPSGGERGDGILLLDIGVEGIVKDAEAGLAQPVEVGAGLLAGVEQVAFEAVERLERADQPWPATARWTSAQRASSASLGPSPENTPSGWYQGPTSACAPSAAQQSITRRR
jgi:hypothetical protein